MTIEKIVQGVNEQLAGELLTYNDMRPFLNEVIDDINMKLTTSFPEFTETTTTYTAFPDRFIRSVLIKGAAFKFYVMDEEGIPTAQQYNYNYQDALFMMLRTYAESISTSKPDYIEDYVL